MRAATNEELRRIEAQMRTDALRARIEAVRAAEERGDPMPWDAGPDDPADRVRAHEAVGAIMRLPEGSR